MSKSPKKYGSGDIETLNADSSAIKANEITIN